MDVTASAHTVKVEAIVIRFIQSLVADLVETAAKQNVRSMFSFKEIVWRQKSGSLFFCKLLIH